MDVPGFASRGSPAFAILMDVPEFVLMDVPEFAFAGSFEP